jgi:hypothetical protein
MAWLLSAVLLVLLVSLPLNQVHLLGFSWAGSDEGKMRSTFGVGQKDFGRFLDLQMVAQGLGYHGFGLARLTRQVCCACCAL